MAPLMYFECNRFRRTIIYLYAFLDALLRVLGGREHGETPQQKHSLLLETNLRTKIASTTRSYWKKLD